MVELETAERRTNSQFSLVIHATPIDGLGYHRSANVHREYRYSD